MTDGSASPGGEAPQPTARVAERRAKRRERLAAPTPPGWRTGPPDFVGVGVQRAGTKWWYRLICAHPAVQRAPVRELHFFDRFGSRPFGDDDVAAYHRLLPRPTGAITGEWTPRYMHDFWTPPLIRRAAPDAKLLVLLRDPWDRFVSGAVHEARVFSYEVNGDGGDHVTATVTSDALGRSLYAQQLARLFEHFERSRVLVLQYERCVADPAAELRRTYEFLGLEQADGAGPTGPERRVGVSTKDAHGLPEHLRMAAAATIARDAAKLRELMPEIDLSLWPSCGR